MLADRLRQRVELIIVKSAASGGLSVRDRAAARVDYLDLADPELADPGFDLLAVADHDPHDVVRHDHRLGRFDNVGHRSAAYELAVGVPLRIVEPEQDDLGEPVPNRADDRKGRRSPGCHRTSPFKGPRSTR